VLRPLLKLSYPWCGIVNGIATVLRLLACGYRLARGETFRRELKTLGDGSRRTMPETHQDMLLAISSSKK